MKPESLPTMPTGQEPGELIERSSIGFWLWLAFLSLVVLAMHGKTVPFNNELLYLLRLEPGFLANDWSFSQAANEHWLFNSLFSIPAAYFPMGAVAWSGRVACWALCLAAIIRLGKVWGLSHILIAGSVGVWLAFGQAVVNAEWIFGTFEAKTAAYVCLLFSLEAFARGRSRLPAALLGLSFSFHPAVGLWAIPAVGLALLLNKRSVRDLVQVAGLTFVFCLPGIIPLMSEQTTADSATFADWEFIVTKHMPFHFDPFYFSQIGLAVLVVMFGVVVAGLWRTRNNALRFLLSFEIAIAAFFVFGIVLRMAESFPLLRFMPMRLFPIITPLFFLFTIGYLLTRASGTARKGLVLLLGLVVVAPLHPIAKGINQVRETKDSWRAHNDEMENALTWISANTPQDAVIVSSPNIRKIWYYSRRAQIASYAYPRYDRLSEWRHRIGVLTGNADIVNRDLAPGIIEAAFDNLSTDQLVDIGRTYRASYLLSISDYPFPVLFSSGKYKIYSLPKDSSDR